MDKFFAYYGYTVFWLIFIMIHIDYWFMDGSIDTYLCIVAMGNLWMWIKYRLKLTHVTRHISKPVKQRNYDV